MVVEMMNSEDRWMSFMSDRLPEQLDDASKGLNAEFYMASKKLTPNRITGSNTHGLSVDPHD
eukprot:10764906-Lingulodinium_polyedra.AAC.1